jgi:NADPH2:quinone reductase
VFWLAFTKNEPAASQRNNDELTQLVQAGRLKPYLHATYPLERAGQALEEVLAQRSSGKVVLIP